MGVRWLLHVVCKGVPCLQVCAAVLVFVHKLPSRHCPGVCRARPSGCACVCTSCPVSGVHLLCWWCLHFAVHDAVPPRHCPGVALCALALLSSISVLHHPCGTRSGTGPVFVLCSIMERMMQLLTRGAHHSSHIVVPFTFRLAQLNLLPAVTWIVCVCVCSACTCATAACFSGEVAR